MGLVLNLNLIHMVLIGMASMFQTLAGQKLKNDQEEQELVDLIMDSEQEALEQLRQEIGESNQYDIDAVKFCQENPEKCIKKFKVNRRVDLEVIEHAPKLFRLVRRGLKTE